jgi:GT2 family glycosyltransferase
MDKTAIVILNWNGLEYLKMFLGTVVRYSDYPGTSIYIADNGSTDGSADWLKANFKEVSIIELEKNFGFAGGYNLAVEKIDAEYFLLLNSDIEVTEGWLRPLVKFMDENPDVASCQPKIRSFHRKDFFEHAGAAGCYIDKYGFPFCRGRILDSIEKDSGQYDSSVNTFWTSGACMIVRSQAWRKCGGFDADFFAHMEEIDLCWRFNKAGYRTCYIPDSTVYHIGGGSLPYNSPFKVYLNFRNSLFLLYKNLPDRNLRKILFIRKSFDGLAAIMFLFKTNFGCFRAVLNAHLDYYKSTKALRIKRKKVKELGEGHFSPPVLNKSIVFEFYAKGKKTFESLKTEL